MRAGEFALNVRDNQVSMLQVCMAPPGHPVSVSRVTEVAVFLVVNQNSPLTKEETLKSKYWPKAGGSLFRQKSLEGGTTLFC
jgi:hypothetical protein